MMRIVQAIAGPYPAMRGSQVLVGHLAAGLRARGHEVVVASFGRRLARAPGFRPERVLWDAGLAARLCRLVASGRVDVVHAHNYEAGLAALVAARTCGVPVVFHGHSAMRAEMPLYFARARAQAAARRVGRWLDGLVPRRADACIAVSDELAAALRAAGARRVVSLPPALPPGEQAARAGAHEEERLVCYAGNLDAYQNLAVLLDAAGRLRVRAADARLVLVSHPDAHRGARALRHRGLPDGVEIVLASSYDEVGAWLARACVLVSPRSERTGFPMKLLNYMAVGKAIVAAEGSAKGLRDGVTARVVPDGDAAALADAMADLLEAPAERRRLGAAARAQVDAVGAWEHGLHVLERLYGEVGCRPRLAAATSVGA